MNPDLRAATLAASNIGVPASSLGASNAPEIAKLYEAGFQLPQAKLAAGAQAQNAQNVVTEQENAAKLAAQKEKDKANIGAYKIVKKGDGGYDFFDPAGQQVDIATVSQRTGAKPAEILKDSENPTDIQYVQDYSNLQDFIRAVLSGDKKKRDSYIAAQPELKSYSDKGGVSRLITDFQKSYQRFYVPRSTDPNAWGYSVPKSPVVPTNLTGADALLGAGDGGVGSN